MSKQVSQPYYWDTLTLFINGNSYLGVLNKSITEVSIYNNSINDCVLYFDVYDNNTEGFRFFQLSVIKFDILLSDRIITLVKKALKEERWDDNYESAPLLIIDIDNNKLYFKSLNGDIINIEIPTKEFTIYNIEYNHRHRSLIKYFIIKNIKKDKFRTLIKVDKHIQFFFKNSINIKGL